MPTRYLKSGVRDSESLDALSPLAETFFYRLLVTVDDFGRFDARPNMLKAQCFPIKDSVTPKKCQELLAELADAGLVLVYSHEGKSTLQMCKWDNIPRSKESKYPAYVQDCTQMHTSANIPRTVIPLTVTVTETQTVAPDGFEEVYQAYPKKIGKPAAMKAFKAAKLKPDDVKTILEDLAKRKHSADWTKDGGQFIPHPATYLNQRRWEDDSEAPESTERTRYI